jgi:Zn finger protein HypA/HybF involved in hydrogenase expression
MKATIHCHNCETEFVIECDELIKFCPVCGTKESDLEEIYSASEEEVWD